MPPYADIYALAPRRTTDVVRQFLARFAPEREEMTENYEVPQYETAAVLSFDSADALIDDLASNRTVPYSIYWKNTGSDGPAFVMAFFTTDEALILGLSCVEEDSLRWLDALTDFAGTSAACVLFEQPPPDSAAEFLRLCR